MANGRVDSRCDNCGGYDDHPKLHYGAEVYHHDCIPVRVMDDIESETEYQMVDTGVGQELRMVSRRKFSDDEVPEPVARLRKIVDKAKAQKPVSEDADKGKKLLTFIDTLHKEK